MNVGSKNRDSAGKFAPKAGARVEKVCPVCAVRFLAWSKGLRPTRACSHRCAAVLMKRRSREDRICRECGKPFSYLLSNQRGDRRRGQYCSVLCRNAAKVKRFAARGVAPRYKNEAHLKADKEWKEAVRLKDNYTCQRCGKYDKRVHAHHVGTRARRPDLIHVVANGKCLCAACHAWVHRHPLESVAAGWISDESYEKVSQFVPQ